MTCEADKDSLCFQSLKEHCAFSSSVSTLSSRFSVRRGLTQYGTVLSFVKRLHFDSHYLDQASRLPVFEVYLCVYIPCDTESHSVKNNGAEYNLLLFPRRISLDLRVCGRFHLQTSRTCDVSYPFRRAGQRPVFCSADSEKPCGPHDVSISVFELRMDKEASRAAPCFSGSVFYVRVAPFLL